MAEAPARKRWYDSRKVKWLAAAAALLLVLLAVAAYRWSTLTDPAAGTGGPVQVTAGELAAAFDADPRAAEATYDGRAVIVTGRLAAVAVGPGGDPAVSLIGDDPLLEVTAALNKSDADQIAAIPAGSVATLTCSRVSFIGDSPALSECAIGGNRAPAQLGGMASGA